MPIYEYRCLACGRVNEFLAGMGEKSDPLVCRECGGKGFERLMSSSNFSMGSRKETGSGSSRCCGADAPHGDCVPGSCCGSNK
jgi:putative FmdB family regulatory protein